MQARILDECESARKRTQQDSRSREAKGETSSEGSQHGHYDPLRVVVEEVLVLNLRSLKGEEIGQLRELIERVAYNGYSGYAFPSVGIMVPTPYLHAFATLEAVRRGADLSGSGGEPAETARRLSRWDSKKERPFIRFQDALHIFRESRDEQSWMDEVSAQKADEEGVFLRVVKLCQAQGAILLTHVDGDGQNQRDVGDGTTTSDVNLVIHTNPAWFADLVRRIVDVRLLEPLKQENVFDALKTYGSASCSVQLSIQHKRFFKAGEVSREYLKFLWLRDMGLGPRPISTIAPPLEMEEEDISAMVKGLVDVRFMFPVRDEDGGVVPDKYVVASCLPDHVGYDVDPGTMLQLKVGGAIFSRKLEVVGARAVPPGLVPRLLAWCGRGDARIHVCWKFGVCFAFRNHLVLVYERRIAGASYIQCHAMGSAHDESAGRALNDVVKELGLLASDPNYGFRGVRLFVAGDEAGDIVKRTADLDDQLQFLLTSLEDSMTDHMNVKFEELERKSETIAGSRRCTCGHIWNERNRKSMRYREVDAIGFYEPQYRLITIRWKRTQLKTFFNVRSYVSQPRRNEIIPQIVAIWARVGFSTHGFG